MSDAARPRHTTTLSSDEFEGRAPGTRGEERTVDFLVDSSRNSAWSRETPTAPISRKCRSSASRADGAPLVFKKGTTEQRLKWKDDVVAWTKHVADRASLDESELVFVGYGVVAPEYNWDDYKGSTLTARRS